MSELSIQGKKNGTLKYKLPKKPSSPSHFWIQQTTDDGTILENQRLFITFAAAKQRAANLVRKGVHSALIIHGAADPNDPPAKAILAGFCQEPLQGHRRFNNAIAKI